MNDPSILSRAKSIKETTNPEEVAQLLMQGNWIAVDAYTQPDGTHFILIRLF